MTCQLCDVFLELSGRWADFCISPVNIICTAWLFNLNRWQSSTAHANGLFLLIYIFRLQSNFCCTSIGPSQHHVGFTLLKIDTSKTSPIKTPRVTPRLALFSSCQTKNTSCYEIGSKLVRLWFRSREGAGRSSGQIRAPDLQFAIESWYKLWISNQLKFLACS